MRLYVLHRPCIARLVLYLAHAPLVTEDDVQSSSPYLEAYIGHDGEAGSDTATVHVAWLSVPEPLRGRGCATRLLGACARYGRRVTLDDASDRCRAAKNVYVLAGFRYLEAHGPEMAGSARRVARATALRQRALAGRAPPFPLCDERPVGRHARGKITLTGGGEKKIESGLPSDSRRE